MPILANTVIASLEEDIPRYEKIIAREGTKQWGQGVEHDGKFYDVLSDYKDTAIPGLEDCNLMLLRDAARNIVYSCYYKLVGIRGIGTRIVQVEVRCNVPGLARAAMHYFMHFPNAALRTDISNTPAGRKMWERFIAQRGYGYHFHLAELLIDLRTPFGATNQDANQVETFENLRHYSPDEEIWHPNRKSGYVTVVYATKESLLL